MIKIHQIAAIPGDSPEEVTRERALDVLKDRFPPSRGPQGYVVGRTLLRNAIADNTGCSLARAEQLILELHDEGSLNYGRPAGELETAPGFWTVSVAGT